MNEFSLLDLLVLGVLGVFVYTRFFGTKLPKDKGKAGADILDFPKTTVQGAPLSRAARDAEVSRQRQDQIQSASGVDKIRLADPSFHELEFVAGAVKAYEMYHQALATADEDTLQDLLSPRLFQKVVDELPDLQGTPAFRQMADASIVDARVNGRTVILDVKYVADHADGSRKTTVWTWARSLASTDPNWELEDMKALS
jgi:predicted lipid-binding transport protein (Tim44 family)